MQDFWQGKDKEQRGEKAVESSGNTAGSQSWAEGTMIKVTSHIHLTFIKSGICAGEKGGKK